MLTFVFFALIVLAGTFGELCISRGMKRVGEPASFHPVELVKVARRALFQPWMWIGVGLMALGFFALLGTLARFNVSFVVPVTALSYVVGALGGVVFLHEHVSLRRWIGAALVAIGVTLVVLGNG
ncbi:MAG TPA: EamA family transporter [Terracidiphilus sp.]|nr:EamA family transporter [Terracidiphilus sp.]